MTENARRSEWALIENSGGRRRCLRASDEAEMEERFSGTKISARKANWHVPKRT